MKRNKSNSAIDRIATHQHELMRVFDFTADDLAENMEHRITRRQHSRLAQTYQLNWRVVSGAFAVILIWSALCFAGTTPDVGGLQTFLGIVVVLTAALLGFLGIVWASNRRLVQNDIDDVVEMVCGKPEKAIHKSRATLGDNIRTYTVETPIIEIQQQRFRLTKKQCQKISETQAYCIYYAAASEIILSMRPIESVGDQPFNEN